MQLQLQTASVAGYSIYRDSSFTWSRNLLYLGTQCLMIVANIDHIQVYFSPDLILFFWKVFEYIMLYVPCILSWFEVKTN
jgi:hypothetical protein